MKYKDHKKEYRTGQDYGWAGRGDEFDRVDEAYKGNGRAD